MFLPETMPTEVQDLCQRNLPLAVSGLPMIKWGVDGKDVFYGANEEAIHMPFVPRLATVAIINATGHSHLDSRFFGEYCALTGMNPQTGDEYMFGVRPELNFGLVLDGITNVQE